MNDITNDYSTKNLVKAFLIGVTKGYFQALLIHILAWTGLAVLALTIDKIVTFFKRNKK